MLLVSLLNHSVDNNPKNSPAYYTIKEWGEGKHCVKKRNSKYLRNSIVKTTGVHTTCEHPKRILRARHRVSNPIIPDNED